MLALPFASFAVFILGILLAIIGFSFNPKALTHRIFALGMADISLWAILMTIIYQLDATADNHMIIQAMSITATMVNPLVAWFILTVSKAPLANNAKLQLLMWGSCLLLALWDLIGGTYISGLVSTPWGNAFVIETGLRYWLQIVVMLLHFAIVAYAIIQGIRRSVSKYFRLQLILIGILAPLLQGGIIAANFMLPIIFRQQFPSTGILFWGAVEIVLFGAILTIKLLEDEVSIILQGAEYSKNRPVIYCRMDQSISGMNDEARRLLSDNGLLQQDLSIADIVRNRSSYEELMKALSLQNRGASITLADGLSSISLLPDGMFENNSSGAKIMADDSSHMRDTAVTRSVKHFSLSPREQEVLELLLQGYSTAEIAGQLDISHSTAKTHIANIHNKVGSSSRPALLARVLHLNQSAAEISS